MNLRITEPERRRPFLFNAAVLHVSAGGGAIFNTARSPEIGCLLRHISILISSRCKE